MLYTHLLFAASLAKLASAYTPPMNATFGALLTPDKSHPVTQGKPYKVTWDTSGHQTDGVTVSLVLCNGPSSKCIPQDTAIAEDIPAGQKSYDWNVPCSLPIGTQSTSSGYGMLIIVDGTGEFQYSTQFSVLQNSTCSGSASDGSGSATSSASRSVTSGPAYQNSTMTMSTSQSSASSTNFVTTGSFTPTQTSSSRGSSATQSGNVGNVKAASGAVAGIAALAAAIFAL